MMLLFAFLSAGLGAFQSGPGSLPPDVWVHDGDSDGDGLTDAFEIAHGLDPHKTTSFTDGTPDEARLDASGRTMWEVQEAQKASTASGACGATGLEVLLCLLLVRTFTRRTWDH